MFAGLCSDLHKLDPAINISRSRAGTLAPEREESVAPGTMVGKGGAGHNLVGLVHSARPTCDRVHVQSIGSVERSLSTSEPTSEPAGTNEPTSEASGSGRPRRRWRRVGIVAVLLICVVLLGLELLFAVSAASQSGCGLCHVPARAQDELSHSSHKGTACSTCHRAPGVPGVVRNNLQAADHFVTWLTRRPASYSGQESVVQAACRDCHQQLGGRVVTVGGVKMSHKQVMESAEGDTRSARLPCTGCHAQVAHEAAPGGVASLDPHTTCLGCHDGLTASNQCSTCHEGAGPERLASATKMASPHPPGWGGGHGMGDQSTCSLCHPSSYCEDCHKVSLPHDPVTYIYTHGKEASAGSESCFSCHSQTSCDDCHKVPMPHDATYLPQHGSDAKKRGADVCLGCHIADGCEACHVKHIHPGVPKSVQEKLKAQAAATGSSVPTTSTTSAASGGS